MLTRKTHGSLALVLALLVAGGVAGGVACNGKPATPGRSASNAGGEPGALDYLPEPERIVLEAEAGNVAAPFEVEENEGASGGKCVLLAEVWATHTELHPAFKTRTGGEPVSEKGLAENPVGRALVPNGMVEIPFEVKKTGRYAFHVRAWLSSSCGNSLHFAVDEEPPVDTDGNATYDERPPHKLTGSTYERWKWFEQKRARFDLGEGAHVLRIYPREDGLRIDQFFFGELLEGADPLVPQGLEEPTAGGAAEVTE